MFILFFFLFGLIIGSFLNVCIYRLPLHQSLVAPRSHCTMCGKQLALLDLIPLFSYILLRSRCRYCSSAISIRYAAIELLTGVIYVGCLQVIGLSAQLVQALILSSFLIVITVIDYDHQLILDKVVIWLAGTGVVINVLTGTVSPLDMLLAGLLGGGLLLVIAIVSRGGMGGGDIKFAAALGLWLGWKLTLLTLLLSFISGGLAGAIILLCKLRGRKDYIPFGPFIAFGAFLSLLYGHHIMRWYVNQFL